MTKPKNPSRSRSLRALVLLLVLGALGAGGFFAWKLLKGIQMPEAPLANVPRSATIVGFVRVGNVIHSEIVRTLLSREVLEARLERIRERCGFDPASQVDDAILFVDGTQARQLDSIGIVARGPFDHEKLSRCFREAFREEGLGQMRMLQIDGVPAAAPAEGEERAAFLGQRGIAIGDEATVRQVIGVVRDRRPSAAADPVLARLWDRVASGRDIVLIGHLPTNWQQSVRDLAGVDPNIAFREIIDAVRAFGVGATVTNGLQIGAVLAMRDNAAATSIATDTRAQLDQLTANVLVSLTPFGPVVRSIRTEQHGEDFVVTVDLPRERLDRMIEFATGWANDRAARAVPGGGAGGPSLAPGIQALPVPAPVP